MTDLAPVLLLGGVLGFQAGFAMGWFGCRVNLDLVEPDVLIPRRVARIIGAIRERMRRTRPAASARRQEPELAGVRKGPGSDDG
ncbi:hypothetical protein K1T35_47940 (plasmid) [Pseudonocardia sp. DSM 110487]|uniref:hypothetical protein n=1 Tax=Pseudonocardia sp. DSM 110487 TaxID=2865833 RepID=UPI001C6993E5|nr:hypothetical protein [Pseudonocardia sp. DSM 110487]QYN41083.1 hypothetical protein K1T35_47940 [Pseudonocardia sp. DSM 110487]